MSEYVPIKIGKPIAFDPLEASRSAAIIKYLNALPRCKAVKRHQTGWNKKGEPDISGCINGRHFELETKRPKKKPTILQQQRIREWLEAGAIAGRVESVTDTKALFREFGVEI